MTTNDNWESEDTIDLRTRIALKVLLLIFKVLSPYKFASQFAKEIEELQKEIMSL